MNIEQFESEPEMHPIIAEVTAPREEPDHTGESLRRNGEDVAEIILREFGVDPNDATGVMNAIRRERPTQRKAQLSNLYREWQKKHRDEDSGSSPE